MMKKRMTMLLVLGVMLGGLVLFNNSTASAKSFYDWTAPKKSKAPIYYTNTNKNAYIWNSTHTKKLHNLKNYPKSTWLVTQSIKQTFNGKTAIYYKVTNIYKSKISGYVWQGFVVPAIVSPIDNYKTDKDYSHFLNHSKTQKLSRALLNIMPKTTVNLQLSQEAASNKITNFKNVINLTNIKGKFIINKKSKTESVYDYLKAGHAAGTTAKRADAIAKTLKSKGYTPKKLTTLIKSGYKLGIYVNDGAATGSTTDVAMPNTLTYANTSTVHYSLVLAQSK